MNFAYNNSKILSVINTPIQEKHATVTRLFSFIEKNIATAKPAKADTGDAVAYKIAGKVIAVRHA